jgi:hypothetical protein
MYWISFLVLLLISLSILASPIIAVLIAIPFVLAFFVWIGLSRRADQMPTQGPGEPEPTHLTSPSTTDGIWGERQDLD